MPKRPNILLLTDDQHRADFYGFTGVVPTLQTPTLDRLHAEGATFTDAWSNCPICVPTRFTWLYGLYPSQARRGLLHNSGSWPDGMPSMAHALQNAGYVTSMIGKLHSAAFVNGNLDVSAPENRENTSARGFDHVWEVCGRSLAYAHDCNWTHHLKSHDLLDAYRQDLEERKAHLCWNETYKPSLLDEPHQVDTLVANEAVRWIESYNNEKPFFLHASFCGPHFPLDPPQAYFDRYNPDDMPDPCGVNDADECAYWREQRAAYCGLIEFTDAQMGRVIAALESSDLLENTIILFTTDHGDRIGDQGSYHKGQPQDGSCRTPVMVRYPALVPQGVNCGGMVEAADIPLSLLRAAGIEEPINFLLPDSPAQSFWDAACKGVDALREDAYAETAQWRMIVTPEWKYILNREQGEQLFHRVTDPDDSNDLHNNKQYEFILHAMRQRMLGRIFTLCAPNPAGFYQERDARQGKARAIRDATSKNPRIASRSSQGS